jgi:hypothetical protein
MQRGPQVLVETTQNFLATIDQGRLDPQPVKDIGELDADISAADDGDRLGKFIEVKGFVRGDAIFVAG